VEKFEENHAQKLRKKISEYEPPSESQVFIWFLLDILIADLNVNPSLLRDSQ